MSTRALYSFLGSKETGSPHHFNVYKHHDGYPSGAAETLKNTIDHFAWALPRYESNEFAASFCGACKDGGGGGGVRLMPQGDPATVASRNCPDIEFRYEISCPNGVLQVRALTADEEQLFNGPFNQFYDWAKKI